MKWWLTVLLTLLASSALASSALAQPRATAEALFRQAKALAKDGDFAGACPKFAESQRLDPQLGTLLHLATCREKQGKTASAWADFSQAADLAAARGDKREKLARKKSDELSRKLARLKIELSQSMSEVTVTVDGSVIGAETLASSFPVDPGTVEVIVERQGGERWESTVDIEPGPGNRSLAVPKLDVEAAPETDATTDDDGALRTAGLIAGGIGVAGVVVLGIFSALALSQASAADEHCQGRFCDDEGLSGHDDARASAAVATVGFVVGAVGLATGLTLLVVAPSSDSAYLHMTVAF